ncbi:MAG: hypothetical protein QM675_08610 [Protaetiibacter sp.]
MLSRLIRREEGYILPLVIGLGLVLVLVTTVALQSVSSGSVKSDTETDWNAALSAAYAGIEDYSSRVENDTTYVQYGNPDAPFSEGSTNLTLPTGSNENLAFEITEGGDWATVPGSDGEAQFRYEVNTSTYASTGVIRIRSTGKVGEQTRSVIADLRQDGFSDFVYFTDYEVQDPQITGLSYCENYWWNRPPQKTSGVTGYTSGSTSCADIQFASTDTINGKVHSNDRILTCGATFNGLVTTASTTSPLYGTGSGCSAAAFNGGGPDKVSAISMPDTNSAMKSETRSDLPSEVPDPGCLYTGPTVIKLNGDGTMTVWSPFTKATQTTGSNTGSTPAKCGTVGTTGNTLGSTSGATIDVLDLNLVYVQNVPTTSTDPNYTSTSTTSFSNFYCSGTGASQGWRIAASSSTTTYAQKFPWVSGSYSEVIPSSSSSTTPAYGCRNGDLYISGAISGRMTAAAENYVYITGDLTYVDTTEDLLGLVGQNAVWIWNPMRTTTSGSTTTYYPMLGTNRTIYASLLSVAHTIQVQNYDKATGTSRGTLTIVGSMAQKFRGPVGTSSPTGYSKSYNYDSRLTYTAPPKYLTPTSTTYTATQIAGAPAAFDANGAPK